MPNYFDSMLERMLMGANPNELSHNELFGARRAASEMEDQRLRGMLGSRRERREGEPTGSYAATRFPGIEHRIWAEEQGFMPRGFSWNNLAGEKPQDYQNRLRRQRNWAGGQRGTLGMSPTDMGFGRR